MMDCSSSAALPSLESPPHPFSTASRSAVQRSSTPRTAASKAGLCCCASCTRAWPMHAARACSALVNPVPEAMSEPLRSSMAA